MRRSPELWKRSLRRGALAIGACAALVACAPVSSLRVTSRDRSRVLEPQIATSVYRMIDPNTADIFLSDLPPEQIVARLARCAGGEPGTPGTIVHLHLFLVPRAGRTPIEFTASNTSLTQLVITGQSAGVYGGGAFMLLSSDVGDALLRGKMREGTVRLTRISDGFVDRLGPSLVSGVIAAKRDDALADAIGVQLLRALSRQQSLAE